MRFPIQMKIIDCNSVLTEGDLHQVENMIWLRLAPKIAEIISVKFVISRVGNEQYGHEHVVQIATRLKSQKLVESRTTRVGKGAALMASLDRMKYAVEQRLRIESSLSYRAYRWFKSVLGGNMGSVGRSFQSTRDSYSSSAT